MRKLLLLLVEVVVIELEWVCVVIIRVIWIGFLVGPSRARIHPKWIKGGISGPRTSECHQSEAPNSQIDVYRNLPVGIVVGVFGHFLLPESPAARRL